MGAADTWAASSNYFKTKKVSWAVVRETYRIEQQQA